MLYSLQKMSYDITTLYHGRIIWSFDKYISIMWLLWNVTNGMNDEVTYFPLNNEGQVCAPTKHLQNLAPTKHLGQCQNNKHLLVPYMITQWRKHVQWTTRNEHGSQNLIKQWIQQFLFVITPKMEIQMKQMLL